MSKKIIGILKAKEIKVYSRKDELVSRFLLFRESLLKELEQFIDAAINETLQSVKKLKRIHDTRELAEVEFTLNHLELLLVSTDDVNKLELEKANLAAKVFIYAGRDETHTPLLEIAYIESTNNEYVVRAQWFSNNGPRQIFKEKAGSGELVDKLVLSLVNHFYGWEFSWEDKPTLKSARGKESKRPFGFIP